MLLTRISLDFYYIFVLGILYWAVWLQQSNLFRCHKLFTVDTEWG